MPIKQVLTDQRIPVKIWTDEVDDNSKKQLTNIASLPFIHHHVAAMPDVHLGIGATIGSVIATHKAIIPAAVGVDIPVRKSGLGFWGTAGALMLGWGIGEALFGNDDCGHDGGA